MQNWTKTEEGQVVQSQLVFMQRVASPFVDTQLSTQLWRTIGDFWCRSLRSSSCRTAWSSPPARMTRWPGEKWPGERGYMTRWPGEEKKSEFHLQQVPQQILQVWREVWGEANLKMKRLNVVVVGGGFCWSQLQAILFNTCSPQPVCGPKANGKLSS